MPPAWLQAYRALRGGSAACCVVLNGLQDTYREQTMSAGRRAQKSLDVRSVRERFRHLHTAASLGAASQQSMPSAASMDAHTCPSPVLSARSVQLPAPPDAAVSTATSQRCTPSNALSDARQRTESPQHVQLPQPHSAAASKASILLDFAQHKKAELSAESGRVKGTAGVLVNGNDVADKSNAAGASSARVLPEQQQIHVCSSRVCGLQVRSSIPFSLPKKHLTGLQLLRALPKGTQVNLAQGE